MLFSCSNGLLKDPRLYNSKKDAGGNSALVVAPEPELDLTGGVDPFDNTEEWYNKPNSNGDGETPGNDDFPHTDFAQMSLVGTYFNNSNVPVYAMQSGDVWKPLDTAKGEYVHAKAPDTEGQGYGISNVHWYQYRGRNPLYAPDGGGYNSLLQSTGKGNPKLSRFYFYSFTGQTLSPSLDNCLFAVDTYSKLMFAFAKPTASKNVFGNNVPTAWGPTDNEPYKDGIVYQFYMYDPVGYVEKKDGKYSVVMYDWFKNNLAKGVYTPTLGEAGSELAKKKPDGAGKSPFNNHTVDNFALNMKLFAGKTFMCREKLDNGGNGLKLYTFSISEDGTKLTKKTEVWRGLEETPADVVYTIGAGETSTKGVVSGGDSKLSWLEVKDEGRTLVLSDGTTATTSFQDYGPDWLLRVRGQTYSHKDGYSFTFSSDGKTITFKNPNAGLFGQKEASYTFTQQDAGNRAVYYQQAAVYWGFRLDDNDHTLYCTSTSWASAGTTPTSSAGAWPAYIHHEVGATFQDTVKNMTFSVRKKDGDGLYDLDLHSYRFSSDGNTVIHSVTPWQKSGQEQGSHSVSSSSATEATINGQKATLTTPEDAHWTLTIGDETYYGHYSDPGPSFLNRVKGATYIRGNTKYTFSEDGKTLKFEREQPWHEFISGVFIVKPGTYTYDAGSDKDNVIATYGGYRVQLTKNDTVINIATVPNVGDASTMEYGADRH